MRPVVDTLSDVIGHKKEIKVRAGVRCCKICSQKLSMYNNGFYCFLHVTEGMERESLVIENKRKARNKELGKVWNKRYYDKMRNRRLALCDKKR